MIIKNDIFPVTRCDLDVPGKIRFQESETLSLGSGLAKFETSKTLYSKCNTKVSPFYRITRQLRSEVFSVDKLDYSQKIAKLSSI